MNKTLAFHTSVNYEILAPEPFSADVHENLLVDLARINQQSYPSDFDLHIDISQTLKRLNDGHCVYVNNCYDCTCALHFVPLSNADLLFMKRYSLRSFPSLLSSSRTRTARRACTLRPRRSLLRPLSLRTNSTSGRTRCPAR